MDEKEFELLAQRVAEQLMNSEEFLKAVHEAAIKKNMKYQASC